MVGSGAELGADLRVELESKPTTRKSIMNCGRCQINCRGQKDQGQEVKVDCMEIGRETDTPLPAPWDQCPPPWGQWPGGEVPAWRPGGRRR